jgi:hypothetical protein
VRYWKKEKKEIGRPSASLPSPAGLSAVFIKHCVTLLLLLFPPFSPTSAGERQTHADCFSHGGTDLIKSWKTISPWQQSLDFDQDRKRWKIKFLAFLWLQSETAQGPFQWRFQFQMTNEKNNNFGTFEKKSFLDENESKCYPISLF